MDILYIIIPAYNEEANIEAVARDWHKIVCETNPESRLIIFDDGSKDDTFDILKRLQSDLPGLIPIHKDNGGHGATILTGYFYALEHGADYIFQTDSDGQTLSSEFYAFWKKRNEYDAVIGFRNHRQDGWPRVLITITLKHVLHRIFGCNIPDANTPFRLMRRQLLEKHLINIPKDYNLTNVLLSVLFSLYNEKVIYQPITFRPRQGGINNLNLKRIIKIGINAIRDFKEIRKNIFFEVI